MFTCRFSFDCPLHLLIDKTPHGNLCAFNLRFKLCGTSGGDSSEISRGKVSGNGKCCSLTWRRFEAKEINSEFNSNSTSSSSQTALKFLLSHWWENLSNADGKIPKWSRLVSETELAGRDRSCYSDWNFSCRCQMRNVINYAHLHPFQSRYFDWPIFIRLPCSYLRLFLWAACLPTGSELETVKSFRQRSSFGKCGKQNK